MINVSESETKKDLTKDDTSSSTESKDETKPEVKADIKPEVKKEDLAVVIICSTCEKKILAESKEKGAELLQIHELSHENQKPIKKEGTAMSFVLGLCALVFLASFGFGVLYYTGKKKYSKDTKEESK